MPPLRTWLTCVLYLVSQARIIKCSSNAGSAAGSGGGVYGWRHSYSLSTFSPSGNLDQVVRSVRASMLGVPIVAISIPSIDEGQNLPVAEIEPVSETNGSATAMVAASSPSPSSMLPAEGGIYLSVPLRFLATSPFIVDDGTPRVVQITSSICVAHTGVGADGRALCDIAVKMALDYRYVYGEDISAEELLEGLAEKVQEMTMNAGSRPFGCALLVCCLGGYCDRVGISEPTMYRLDPSGAVVLLNTFNGRRHDSSDPAENCRDTIGDPTMKDAVTRASVAFLGNWVPLGQKKDDLRTQIESRHYANHDQIQNMLVDAARQTYVDEPHEMTVESPRQSVVEKLSKPVLFASFTRERGLEISRIIN
ncbi:hypothetical protein ACHAWF_004178 [Thalassiosira exigua]